MTDRTTQETTEAVWRHESKRLIAGRSGSYETSGFAEDLAQDALVAA